MPAGAGPVSALVRAHPGLVVGAGAGAAVHAGVANDFILFQVFGWTFILGMIALSLMFLAGYGGMVSLIQMSVAAMAGYMVAIFGTSGVGGDQHGAALVALYPHRDHHRALFGTIVGALAVRTEGIYTIMITLAIAAAFFYFTRQNYAIFNGYTGFNLVVPPQLFGVDWRQPVPFYYLTLGCAVISYLRGGLCLALALRAGAAGGAGQSAAHGGAWLQRDRAPGGGLYLRQRHRGHRRHPAGLAERADRAGTAGIPAVIDILVIAVSAVSAADRAVHRRLDLRVLLRPSRPMC
jgi:branched-chain amino acid transport system permease protein